MQLVYDIENYSSFEAKNINLFGISESSIETTFAPAYEIAVSYDGQSEKQLGNWDITELYNEDDHGDADDGSVILTENTSKFSKDITYLVGAPATFQVSLIGKDAILVIFVRSAV